MTHALALALTTSLWGDFRVYRQMMLIFGVQNAQRGDKIRSGSLTPAVSGALMWAECLKTHAVLGVPNAS